MTEEKKPRALRPELLQFMESVGLEEEAAQRVLQVQPPGTSQGPPPVNTSGGSFNPLQFMNQLAGRPPAPTAQPSPTNQPQGGLIVKGEIRVDEKYVENVEKVMQGIKQTVLQRDEDGMVEVTDEQASFIEEMMNMVAVKAAGTGTVLDQALVAEMGKAYKERFEVAKAAGDETNMNRAYGSMLALKKVLEMVK